MPAAACTALQTFSSFLALQYVTDEAQQRVEWPRTCEYSWLTKFLAVDYRGPIGVLVGHGTMLLHDPKGCCQSKPWIAKA